MFFSVVNEIQWKSNYDVTTSQAIISSQNYAHATTTLPCAKFCSDHFTTIWMRAKWNFYRIWITKIVSTWWRHQMETFAALLAICAGNSPVPGEFPAQRPMTRSFDVFFDLHLLKRLSKQWWGWWFETLSHPLWRHCNENGPGCSACLPLTSEEDNDVENAFILLVYGCSVKATIYLYHITSMPY